MFDRHHYSYENINDNQDYGEEYLYDTYDQIIDTNIGIFDDIISPEELGLAFALAEEMSDVENQNCEIEKEYNQGIGRNFDIDEDTDKDNWEKATIISSLQARQGEKRRLRPFEQYVDDICKGRRPLFED
jgi:hypothetical protein